MAGGYEGEAFRCQLAGEGREEAGGGAGAGAVEGRDCCCGLGNRCCSGDGCCGSLSGSGFWGCGFFGKDLDFHLTSFVSTNSTLPIIHRDAEGPLGEKKQEQERVHPTSTPVY